MPQVSPQTDRTSAHLNGPTDPQLYNHHSSILSLNPLKSSCRCGTDTLPSLQTCIAAFILSRSPCHYPSGHFQALGSISTPGSPCNIWPCSCRGTVCLADLAPHCVFDPAAFTAQGAEPSCQINALLLYCRFLAIKGYCKLYANSQVTAAEWRDIFAVFISSLLCGILFPF